MLTPHPTYEALRDGFAWDLPARLNMAEQVCDAWAAREPERLAVLDLSEGRPERVSYGRLYTLSLRVGDALRRRGVQPGDRVGVLLSQSPLCAAAHIACWRMGAISVPLFTLFRDGALRSRLDGAGIRQVVTDMDSAGQLDGFDVAPIIEADLMPEDMLPPEVSVMAETGPETPAVLIFTSGTTGAPKGALHGHRVLTGHLPGVEVSHDFLGAPGDVLWTPADWAWIGGLFDVLMPGLALGVPVVALRDAKFSSDLLTRVVRDAGVRNVFLPPTALRMAKADGLKLRGLRSVASGGEPLGAEMLAWGRDAFGLTINEFYGQTECNMVASACSTLFEPKHGCLGRASPGCDVAVLDAAGTPVLDEEGDIAVRRGAASMMLGYWQNPEATAAKFRGDWMLTGDRGRLERADIRFVGREDDVITSAGYRIGPGEVEDCLLTHPDVATVGVVGLPDPLRTERVTAFVVRKPGTDVSAEALQDWVKTRLAAHCYPREVRFVTGLPMTVTGKVIRKDLRQSAIQEMTEGEDG